MPSIWERSSAIDTWVHQTALSSIPHGSALRRIRNTNIAVSKVADSLHLVMRQAEIKDVQIFHDVNWI